MQQPITYSCAIIIPTFLDERTTHSVVITIGWAYCFQHRLSLACPTATKLKIGQRCFKSSFKMKLKKKRPLNAYRWSSQTLILSTVQPWRPSFAVTEWSNVDATRGFDGWRMFIPPAPSLFHPALHCSILSLRCTVLSLGCSVVSPFLADFYTLLLLWNRSAGVGV